MHEVKCLYYLVVVAVLLGVDVALLARAGYGCWVGDSIWQIFVYLGASGGLASQVDRVYKKGDVEWKKGEL